MYTTPWIETHQFVQASATPPQKKTGVVPSLKSKASLFFVSSIFPSGVRIVPQCQEGFNRKNNSSAKSVGAAAPKTHVAIRTRTSSPYGCNSQQYHSPDYSSRVRTSSRSCRRYRGMVGVFFLPGTFFPCKSERGYVPADPHPRFLGTNNLE